jgi:hypothetical protein
MFSLILFLYSLQKLHGSFVCGMDMREFVNMTSLNVGIWEKDWNRIKLAGCFYLSLCE